MQERGGQKGSWWSRPRRIIILALVGFVVWYGSGTATVYLENKSIGESIFYVDGAVACRAQALTRCTVRLYLWKPHSLGATTHYADNTYNTPPVYLAYNLQRDAQYEYISCGALGTPGQNCGWFAKDATPPSY